MQALAFIRYLCVCYIHLVNACSNMLVFSVCFCLIMITHWYDHTYRIPMLTFCYGQPPQMLNKLDWVVLLGMLDLGQTIDHLLDFCYKPL